jgi:hypothetical protein
MRPPATRRAWLAGAGLTLLAAPLAAAVAPSRALAAAKTPKAAVNYQYQPRGDQHCGACASFVPGPDPQGPGTCRIVDGPIPQNGWCVLFARK